MNWAEASIKNRYTVYALSLGILIFGAFAYLTLPISLFPDTDPPIATIITAYPGASAADVSDKVTEIIEEEVAALDGIADVSSSSMDGISVITAEFQYGLNVDLAAVDAQNAVSRVEGKLPEGVQKPRVIKTSSKDKPVIELGVSMRDGTLLGVREMVDEEMAPMIQRLPGVSAVDIFGGSARQINVNIDRDKLESYGLTLSAVIGAIEKANVSKPLGRLESRNQEVLLRLDEALISPMDLSELPVTYKHGQRVRIGDVAIVEDGVADPQSAYLSNTRGVVAVQVLQKDDANTVDVVEMVEQLLPELRRQFPGLEIKVATEEASFTKLVVDNMGNAILSALLLAGFIIFLFLESFRRALVVSISMPMSFLLTFVLMKFTGVELNLVTLSAIILAVGMVVDAAVVVIENISRHKDDENLDTTQAAIKGTQEVFFAILVGVGTTLIVLIPFLFLEGFVGKVFGALSKTMIYAFSASILAAVSLIPILFTLLEGKEWSFEKRLAGFVRPFNQAMDRLRDLYVSLLKWSLRNRALVLLAALGLFVVSAVVIQKRGMEVLPKMDSGSFYISLEAEPGSSFQKTKGIVQKIQALLEDEPAVINYTSQIGFEADAKFFGDAGAMGVQQAFMTVDLVSRKDRAETIWDIEQRLRNKISDISGIRTAVVKEMGSTAKSSTSAPLNVRISGNDLMVLDRLAEQVKNRVKAVEGAVNVYRSWTMERPEYLFYIDRAKAADYDINPQLIARETFAAIDGIPVTNLDTKDDVNPPIFVRYDSLYRVNVTDVMSTRIRPSLTLSSVSEMRTTLSPNLVTRENMSETIDIRGYTYNRAFSHVVEDIQKAIETINVPQGYELSITGENSDLQDSMSDMMAAIASAIIGVYLLMVAQFRSFIHPFTVMLAVPLVLVGAAVTMVLGGKIISLAALTGFILLVGIAVNNSVILIDFILNQMKGSSRTERVVNSVKVRFRPIMMTTFSTVIGMIPLAMEWSVGSERFSPMAVVIIGGLTASSFLTMVVVPVFYTVLDDLLHKIGVEQ